MTSCYLSLDLIIYYSSPNAAKQRINVVGITRNTRKKDMVHLNLLNHLLLILLLFATIQLLDKFLLVDLTHGVPGNLGD